MRCGLRNAGITAIATVAALGALYLIRPGPAEPPPKISWAIDYESGLLEARERGMLLVVHFYLRDRPLAGEMEAKTFAAPEVVRRAAAFVNVRIDLSRRPELYEAAIGGRGGLSTCVVDGTQDVVSVLPGFADAPTYVRFLERAGRDYGRLKAARGKAASGDAAALLELGEIYQALESPRRAEAVYRQLLAESKHPAAAHERLARLRIVQGKNLEAREHLDAARKLGAGDREDRLLLTEGLVLAQELKPEEALRTVEGAIEKFPKSPEADQMLLALGYVLHDLKQDARAMASLERLLRDHTDSPWVYAARERIGHIKNPPPGHEH